MTYGFLLLFAFVRTISYHNWFVYIELYYLQFFTIIAYHLDTYNALFRYVLYVITFDIWEVRIMSYYFLIACRLNWKRTFYAHHILRFIVSTWILWIFLTWMQGTGHFNSPYWEIPWPDIFQGSYMPEQPEGRLWDTWSKITTIEFRPFDVIST